MIEAVLTSVVGIRHFVGFVARAVVGEAADFRVEMSGLIEGADVGQVFRIHHQYEVEILEIGGENLPGFACDGIAAFFQGGGHPGVRAMSGVIADGAGRIDFDATGEAGVFDLLTEDDFGGGRATNIAHANKEHTEGLASGVHARQMMPMLSTRIFTAIANAIALLMAMASAAEPGPNVVVVHASNEAVKSVGGTVFPEAIGGPFPAASQAELLSGRHEFACGVSHSFVGRNWVRPDVSLLPERLRQAGYRTALAGDWWLGLALPCRPQDRGFEEVFAPEPDGTLEGRWGVAPGSLVETRKTSALKWLEERAKEGKSFFLELTWPKGESLAALTGEIDRLGLSERTLLIATGEAKSGESFPANTIAPLAFRWPGKYAGRTVSAPVSWQDVAPTVATACGIEFPAGEGIALGPVLSGKTEPASGRKFFLHAGGWPGDDSPARHRMQDFAVRDERWLLQGLEWFDLSKPVETRQSESEPRSAMTAGWLQEYGAWWQRVSTGLQEAVRVSIGDERQPVVRLNASAWWPSREVSEAKGAELCRDQATLRALLEQLADPSRSTALPAISGHWKLNVAREGHYRVTVWKLPPEATEEDRKRFGKLQAGKVHLRAGKFELQSGVLENATAVTVGMDFAQGPVEFEAWFDGQLPGDRILGAFFVSLERVGERKLPDPDWKVQPKPKNP